MAYRRFLLSEAWRQRLTFGKSGLFFQFLTFSEEKIGFKTQYGQSQIRVPCHSTLRKVT